MAFNITSSTGTALQLQKLVESWGGYAGLEAGITALAAGTATVTCKNLSQVWGVVCVEMNATTSHIPLVTATSSNTFTVIFEATSGGGAAAITTDFAYLAWGLPKI